MPRRYRSPHRPSRRPLNSPLSFFRAQAVMLGIFWLIFQNYESTSALENPLNSDILFSACSDCARPMRDSATRIFEPSCSTALMKKYSVVFVPVQFSPNLSFIARASPSAILSDSVFTPAQRVGRLQRLPVGLMGSS